MHYRHTLAATLALAALADSAVAAENDTDDEHHKLEEIIVSATPLERSVEQLAQPTSILSGDALARKQAASVGETLADEAGVSASYFGPVASRPVIRGQFGERVRVLSNGLDALDASALSEDHAVSVDSILAESVEIVRGPATLLYGSGAAGGLVNVVDSRLAETLPGEALSGALALNGDTAIETRSGAIKADISHRNLVYHLDWFRRDTGDVEIPGFVESRILRDLETAAGEAAADPAKGAVENTDGETEGGAAAVSRVGEDGSLGFSVSRYDSNYGIPGHEHEENESAAADDEESIRIDLEQTRFDVRGKYSFDGFIRKAELRFARNDYRHVEFEGGSPGTRFDTAGTDLRIELQHARRGRLEGAFGLQFKDVDFSAEGEEAFVPGSDTLQLSAFVFEEFALSDTWVLQGSARVERQEIEAGPAPTVGETAFGASVGSIWNLPKGVTLSANLALTERNPNATELFADGPHVAVQRYERGAITLGNGPLDKEVSTNLDVTLRGAKGRLEWALTGFVNTVDDYVLLSPTANEIDGFRIFDYGQADVEMYGAEGELLFDIFRNGAGHLHARLFGDFVHGEQRVSGTYLPRLTPLRRGLGFHYTGQRIDAGIDATFVDRQRKTAPNELPTASYTLINAELSYSFSEPDTLVFLRVTNLGDDDARRHTSPLKDTLPLPGRSVHVGLRLEF